jgi:hypothetical protein
MHGTFAQPSDSTRLPALAAEIKRAHAEHLAAARRSLEHAIAAGERLLEAKQLLGAHGAWLPWLKQHVSIPERTCQHYMRLARHRGELLAKSATVADLTVRAALKHLYRGTTEYYTQAKYIEAARRVLGEIDLDPASCAQAQRIIRARTFFTKEVDGLSQPWRGRVWLNPPYCGNAGRFVQKLVAEYRAGQVIAAIILVNARDTDSEWFQALFDFVICFANHRICFDADPPPLAQPTNNSAFVYLGNDAAGFAREFSKFGRSMVPYK